MNKWSWIALGALLLGSIAVMFWVTGIGEEPEPLFESMDYVETGIPARDPRKLTVWAYGGGARQDNWEEQIAVFEEAIGESVDLVRFENAEGYEASLRQAAAQDKLPDLMLVNHRQAQELHGAGQLAPLALPASLAAEWADLTVESLRVPGSEESMMAYPADFSVLVLYYNRRMFDEQGMAAPGDHWSWPILTGIAKSLYRKGEGGRPTRYGVELPLGLELWNAVAAEYGAAVYADGAWLASDLTEDAPQARALKFLLDFYYTYVVVAPPTRGDTGQYFARDASAMAVAGAELIPLLTDSAVDWGVTFLPKQESRASALRLEGWAVRADSAKAREAAELALLLSSESRRAGWLPARLTEPVEEERLAVFYQQLESARPPPGVAVPTGARVIVFEEMKAAIEAGDTDPLGVVQKIGARLFPSAPKPTAE
ncbi:MAG: extracellular solute-binding protein [Verrucomicrobiota bacterium]